MQKGVRKEFNTEKSDFICVLKRPALHLFLKNNIFYELFVSEKRLIKWQIYSDATFLYYRSKE